MIWYASDAKRAYRPGLRGKISGIFQSLNRSSSATAKLGPEEAAPVAVEVSEETVTQFIHAWRERSSYLPSEFLSDPAWGMLLELFQAEIQGRRVSLARLCKVSATSARSALRWLKALEGRELIVRQVDPNDADKELVELSQEGSLALRLYFHDVVQWPGSSEDYY